MSARRRIHTRRVGVTTVESALVLVTLLLLLFSILDVGLAVFRYNVLAATARHIARQAIVHGGNASPEFAPWGPADFDSHADDTSPIAASATNLLPTMPTNKVAMQVTWPDGDNGESDRVRVQLNYTHQPIVPLLYFGEPLQLRAISTMRIAQ